MSGSFDYVENRRDAWHERHAEIAKVLTRIQETVNLMNPSRLEESGRFSDATARIVHAITWGMANLDLPRLVEIASEADLAETKYRLEHPS